MDYHKHFCVFIDHHDCGNRLSDQCIPHECLYRSFYNARVVSKAIHVFEKGFLGSPLGKHCELPQGNRRREAISKSREIIHVLPPLPPPPLFPKWIEDNIYTRVKCDLKKFKVRNDSAGSCRTRFPHINILIIFEMFYYLLVA